MITGSFQKVFWTLTHACLRQDYASTIRPKRIGVPLLYGFGKKATHLNNNR